MNGKLIWRDVLALADGGKELTGQLNTLIVVHQPSNNLPTEQVSIGAGEVHPLAFG